MSQHPIGLQPEQSNAHNGCMLQSAESRDCLSGVVVITSKKNIPGCHRAVPPGVGTLAILRRAQRLRGAIFPSVQGRRLICFSKGRRTNEETSLLRVVAGMAALSHS